MRGGAAATGQPQIRCGGQSSHALRTRPEARVQFPLERVESRATFPSLWLDAAFPQWLQSCGGRGRSDQASLRGLLIHCRPGQRHLPRPPAFDVCIVAPQPSCKLAGLVPKLADCRKHPLTQRFPYCGRAVDHMENRAKGYLCSLGDVMRVDARRQRANL